MSGNRPGRTPENPAKLTDGEQAEALANYAPQYLFATIFESIEFPAGKASTNTFITAKGYRITKDDLGWLHIEWPPTGEVVEFSPSQVKQLRRVPVPPPKVEEKPAS